MELWAIIPELILAGGFLLLLILAPFFEGKKSAIVYWTAALILVAAAATTVRMLHWPVQAVFKGTYILDSLAHFLKLYSIAATLLVLMASYDFFRDTEFWSDVPALLVASALGAGMIAGSLDFALVILFFYILTVATLILIGLFRQSKTGNEAALKYFIFSAAATAIMLYGISLWYGLAGSTSVNATLAVWTKPLSGLALALAGVGLGFKMAMAPFHMWAPDVYEGAPTPISGFLSVLPKAAMIAVILRFGNGSFNSLPDVWQIGFAGIAVLTMTVGNIWALRQTNLKRLLAYSSIAQIGYVLTGVAVIHSRSGGGQAALFYLLTYLFMNIGAFAAVGRIEMSTGSVDINTCAGLFRRSPSLAIAFTVFLLSLSGVPPLAGYIGKIMLLSSVLGGRMGWLAAVMAANFVLAVYYYLRIIAKMFFDEREPRKDNQTQSFWIDVSIAACIVGTFVLGIVPQSFIDWMQSVWPS